MTEIRLEAGVAHDHPCLAGHFPGRPIVPAVLLLELVAEAAASTGAGRLAQVRSAKFRRAVRPGEPLLLRLTAGAGGAIAFEVEAAGQLAAEGVCKFLADAGA